MPDGLGCEAVTKFANYILMAPFPSQYHVFSQIKAVTPEQYQRAAYCILNEASLGADGTRRSLVTLLQRNVVAQALFIKYIIPESILAGFAEPTAKYASEIFNLRRGDPAIGELFAHSTKLAGKDLGAIIEYLRNPDRAIDLSIKLMCILI